MTARIATAADNELLTSIVMHPELRPWTAFDGAPDFDPDRYTKGETKSFAVVVAGGCILAPALEQYAYGVHTNLLPDCRGSKAIRAARGALEFAFLSTDAEQLWTMAPDNNPQARWFAAAMGFRAQFRREAVWLSGGQMHGMEYMRLDVDDWIQGGALRTMGEAFHQARIEQGAPPNHKPDAVHDDYVGAAWGMLAMGQYDKAQRIYNRWARGCGYHPFTLLSIDPLLVDIVDCILGINDDGSLAVEKHTEVDHA